MFQPLLTNKRTSAAFTLMELMVSSAVACAVGLIVYSVATENLVAFEKNFSINRSYGDARRSLDRISVAMQSAGHIPVLIDATGANHLDFACAGHPVLALRFYARLSYYDPSASSTTLSVSLVQPGTTTPYTSPPAVGDMITIPLLGFQAQCTAVNVTSPSSATVSFASNIASNTSPAITTVPTSASIVNSSGKTVAQTIQYTCLDWRSVAFIAVGNQLRYYSHLPRRHD